MIAHLAGRILRKSPQEVVVDVGGVGYRVLIPVSTFYRLGEAGDTTELRVHTHVREDALNLYGFLSAEEQGIFERLIDVSGVGPKLAINILSGIEAAELVAALRSNDVPRLTRVPGVGRKTAERLVLELKDKLAALGPGAPAAEAAPSASAQKEDLLSVLANLGYGRAEAEKCVDRALGETRDGRFEDLLRLTLRLLSGAARG
jgi:Holliday junction DNA helicase RuvA